MRIGNPTVNQLAGLIFYLHRWVFVSQSWPWSAKLTTTDYVVVGSASTSPDSNKSITSISLQLAYGISRSNHLAWTTTTLRWCARDRNGRVDVNSLLLNLDLIRLVLMIFASLYLAFTSNFTVLCLWKNVDVLLVWTQFVPDYLSLLHHYGHCAPYISKEKVMCDWYKLDKVRFWGQRTDYGKNDVIREFLELFVEKYWIHS